MIPTSSNQFRSDTPKVTKPQIEALEAGNVVALTASQLDDLKAHAPSWVDIYIYPEQQSDDRYLVTIKDSRPDAVNENLSRAIRRQIAKDLRAQQRSQR